ncbi:MAG: spore coat protein CotJB [Bacilli bacterium]|nr:spore coat protein CotJB [Bacilli bacterium]
MLFDNGFDVDLYMKNISNLKNNDYLYNNDNSNKIVSDKIGLQKGNMFKDEYLSYKGISPDIIEAKTEKDALMLKIYETCFAITDLGLYLDLHPNDSYMYEVYQNYVSNFEKCKDMFEKNYGPINNTFVDSSNYEWIKNPWPWDKDGGTKYV